MEIDRETQKLIRDTYSELAPELRTAYVHEQAAKYEHENTLIIRSIIEGANISGWYAKPIIGSHAYPIPPKPRKPRRTDLPRKPSSNQKINREALDRMMQDGKNNKEIAEHFGVKENSVANYLCRNGIRREEVKGTTK